MQMSLYTWLITKIYFCKIESIQKKENQKENQ